MLPNLTNSMLKYHNGLFKEGHTIYRADGGVAFFIHETIPYQKKSFNTPPQAITNRVNTGRDKAIVSIYNSQIHVINEKLLSSLFSTYLIQ